MTSSRWYHRPAWLAVWIGLIGPLALPLVWSSPHVMRPLKWTLSIGIVLLTIWLTMMMVRIATLTLSHLKEYPHLHRLLDVTVAR